MEKRPWCLDVLFLSVLGALILAFFWRFITPDGSARILFPDGDFIEQFYPWRYYAAFEIGHGRLPIWTPFANSGHPFLADIQTAVLYPLHLVMDLLVALGGGSQLTVLELELLAIFHFALAGGFTYLFVRQQTGSRLAGLASGLIFTFGGYLTSYPALQLSVLETVVWTPLALFLVSSAVSRRTPLLWALLGVVLAMSVLAGHPQQASYLYYLTVAFAVFTILRQVPREGWPASKMAAACLPHAGGLAMGLVLSVALASAQTLPTWELISFSSRGDELGFQFVREGFDFKEALGLFFPSVWGGRALFIGSIPVLLVAFSLRRPRGSGVFFWAGVAVLAFLLSFGGSLPVYDFAHCCLPGFSWFRDQERAASLVSFAGSVLSGYGVVSVLRWAELDWAARLRAAFRLSVVLAGAAALIAAAGYLAGLQAPSPALSGLVLDASAVALTLGAAGLIIHAARTGRTGRELAMIGLAILAAAQLLAMNWRSFEPGGTSAFEPTPLSAFLQTLPPDRRIELTALPTNLGYVFRLRSARGAGPLVNKYYSNVMERSGPWKAWQLLNTGYVVGRAQESGAIYSYEGKAVYETEYDTLPAYVSFRPRVETDDRAVIDTLVHAGNGASGSGFVFGRDALLSEDTGLPMTGRGYVRSLQVLPDDAGQMLVRVDLTEPGLLVLSEVYSPGWKALLDDNETKIVRVDYLLRGIAVPPGPHVIQLAYQPGSVRIGFVISLAALFLVGAIAVASLHVRSTRKHAGLAILLASAAAVLVFTWTTFYSFPQDRGPAEWQEMSKFLEAKKLPGDVIVTPAGQAPDSLTLPHGIGIRPASDTSSFSGQARVWWVSSPASSQQERARPQASEGLQVVEERWFGNHLLSLLSPPASLVPSGAQRLDAVLDNKIGLLAYDTSIKEAGQAGRTRTLEVFLYWQALEDVQADYTVFVHLLDRDGNVISQNDARPQEGARPTSGWEPQETVADWHVLPLPQSLTAGDYSLIAGLYDAVGGNRLSDGGGKNYVRLGQVMVQP